MIKILQSISFFSNLSEVDLTIIEKIAIKKLIPSNITIFSENEKAIGFYFVVSGSIKIFKLSPEGKEHVLHICKPGDMFAEATMFSGKVYPAYAEAIANSTLLFFPKNDFLGLIKQNPDISIKMLGSLSTKLREFSSMIEDLSLKEVSARLAKYLLDNSLHIGNKSFKLEIKKADLALKLGTVSETLSRTFKKFKKRNIIASDKNNITILDFELLQEVSAGMKI